MARADKTLCPLAGWADEHLTKQGELLVAAWGRAQTPAPARQNLQK